MISEGKDEGRDKALSRQETAASKLDTQHGQNTYLSNDGEWTDCRQRQRQ